MSTTNLAGFRDAASTSGKNIAISKSVGSKYQTTEFVANYIAGKPADVQSVTRNTLNIQGDAVGTGVATDFVLQSNSGMSVVASSSRPGADMLFTRATSFREDQNGFYTNASGHYMMAWQLNENGNLPTNSSLLSSLTPVNFRNLTSKAQATTTVNMSGNLQADAKALKGAGNLFTINKSGLNANTRVTEDKATGLDIIVPEDLAAGGGLRQGDQFIITTRPADQERTYEFGGIAVGMDISKRQGGLYGARNASSNFSIGNGPNQIADGSGIAITIPGNPAFRFTATAAAPSAALGQFNSISSLVAAINATGELKARTDSQNRIYITQKTDPNAQIQFASFGGTLKEDLGLSDVSVAAGGVKRFATMDSLRKTINGETNTTGISGDISGSALSVQAHLATSSFKITGSTNRVNNFQNATIGSANDPTNIKIATYTITSPNHGLKNGDWVNIANSGDARFAAGRYIVENADNGDTFTISPTDPLVATFPLAAPPITVLNAPGAVGTWEKIAAQAFGPLRTATAVDTPGPGQPVTITLNAAEALADGYANGDLVYISGIGGAHTPNGENIDVPDGYYTVTAYVGPTLTIAAIQPAPTAVSDATHPNVVAGNVRVQRITPNAATKDTRVLESVNGQAQVRLYTPNHGYRQGDYIKLEGLPAAGYVVRNADPNNILRNDVAYKVADATNPNYIIFDLPAGMGAFGGLQPAIYAAGAVAQTSVGPAFRVNQYAHAFDYLNMDPGPDAETKAATYDEGSTRNSLFSDKHNAEYTANQAIEVFDSLGIKHNLLLRFAKLDNDKWVVELGGVANSSGTITDIVGAAADGSLAKGQLTFSAEDGSYSSVDGTIARPITINWSDSGAAPSTITINWDSALSGSNGAALQGTRQQNGNSSFDPADQNGFAAGRLENVSIDQNGIISGTFSNGTQRNLFKMPVATFSNINGLMPGEGDTYLVSSTSGAVNLQEAGDGIGTFIGGAVETSNADVTAELLKIQDLQNAIQASARVINTDNQNFKTILSETAR